MAGKLGSRRHSTTSFSKNVVMTETSYQMLEVLRTREGLTSFNIDNSAIFSNEKRSFPGCLFLENTRKNVKLNLVLVLSFSNLKVSNNSCVRDDFSESPFNTDTRIIRTDVPSVSILTGFHYQFYITHAL